ncbi:hypothetical protein [Bacillus pseudomycoides]|nr:hypothetical protein [Bacillus pseudomycoides]
MKKILNGLISKEDGVDLFGNELEKSLEEQVELHNRLVKSKGNDL